MRKMKEITAYKTIISGSGICKFDESVCYAIRDGWQPYGSVCSVGGILCQPMVRYKGDK